MEKMKSYHKAAAMTAVMLKSRPTASKSQYIALWSLLTTDKLPLFEAFYQKVKRQTKILMTEAEKMESDENEKRCTTVFPKAAEYREWEECYCKHFGT